MSRPDASQQVGGRPSVILMGSFPDEGNRVMGGIRVACAALLSSSLPQRWDLHLIDSTMRSIPPPGLLRRLMDASHRSVVYIRALLLRRPDAVVLLSAGGLSLIEKGVYTLLARFAGVPSMLWLLGGEFMVRTWESRWYRAFASMILRWPTLLLTPGPTWQRFYRDAYGISNDRCPVIESWIGDTTLFETHRHDDHTGQAPASILFVGWIERSKGVFELIDAASRLADDPSLPPSQVTLVGGGSALSEARAAVERAGLCKSVSLTGWVSDERKRELLLAADIFVLPTHAEGLPLAMLEAMVVGLPIVATPVGSIPDVLVHEVNGLQVPVRDPERLAAALARLLSDPAERKNMGDAARTYARRFSVERAVEQLDELVRQHRRV